MLTKTLHHANAVTSRGEDKIDGLPDAQLKKEDQQYLERHGIQKMVSELLTTMVKDKPQDPIQFIIDSMEYNQDYAAQDPVTGLSQHRKAKLLDVFKAMDKEGLGKISFPALQSFAIRHGCSPLGDDELRSMFRDYKPGGGQGNLVNLEEFLVYFAKASRTMTNASFDVMIKELMA